MAAKKIEQESETLTPIKTARLFETIELPGVAGLKTLSTKDIPGLKLFRTKDATLLIHINGQVGEVRNFKLLVYA